MTRGGENTRTSRRGKKNVVVVVVVVVVVSVHVHKHLFRHANCV